MSLSMVSVLIKWPRHSVLCPLLAKAFVRSYQPRLVWGCRKWSQYHRWQMGRGMDAERQGRMGEGIFQEKQKVEGGNDVYRYMERHKKIRISGSGKSALGIGIA